ncbi:MAG TPA: hypothetical protein VK699_05695 [Terriglobales bacterium]|jgi:hypothetical protein|nr:hypothetical protein [Terriglobales bacterium]
MNCLRLPSAIAFIVLSAAVSVAQTSCEEGDGPLNSNQPQGTTPQDIIRKFAAKESIFQQARNNYTYTQDVTVQTLSGNTVDGEWRRVWDITYDNQGNRVENVTLAPPGSLTRVKLTQQDYDDIRNQPLFPLTTEELLQYDIVYLGTQHVDEIDTYIFDVTPKHTGKNKPHFQGRIWVDSVDFEIVKTCGKTMHEVRATKDENLYPGFVTYREQIDGQYWFPTYSRADDVLQFTDGGVHIREIIKYTNYKRIGSHARIIFKGETPPDQKPK